MIRRVVILVLTVAAIAGCGINETRPPAPAKIASLPGEPATEREREELSFLAGMVPHHAQAVDMGLLCRDRAADSALLRMCEGIIEVQRAEIAQMKDWGQRWYGTEPSEVLSALHSAEGETGAHGILADEHLHHLGALHGRAFDLAFVQMMLEHHTGAVASAQRVLERAPHAELRELAANIIRAQTAEINQMQQWAQRWS